MRACVMLLVAVALVTPVAAQPAACPACAHGDAVIDHFALQPLRSIAGELAAIPLGDPVTAAQYARIVELRARTPVLARLAALDDADLAAVGEALCHAASGACVDATVRTLRCLADRCTVDLPRAIDLVELPTGCEAQPSHKHSPPFGLGFDWGIGGQRSRYPSDGGAWSFGIEGRMRFGRYFGAVARVDRIAGRDEATDADHDGRDDFSTGTITRITALAGPSIVLHHAWFDDVPRFLRLDLLGGYVSTRSPGRESGPATGVDLAYQLSVVRFGVRVVQGFGDAHDATMVLAHIGSVGGSAPAYDDDTGCTTHGRSPSSRLALGLEFPLGGYGISSELGYLASGLGIEAVWHLTRALDAMTHADLLVYPGIDRDRVLHEAVLAGLRIDHKRRRSSDLGFFTTVMGGYTHGVGLTPTGVGSGPVVDLALAWGGQGADGAAYLRLHTRFGVGPDNLDYRAVFLSVGIELRFDPSRWRDRS